jgi:hypothetical protein
MLNGLGNVSKWLFGLNLGMPTDGWQFLAESFSINLIKPNLVQRQ